MHSRLSHIYIYIYIHVYIYIYICIYRSLGVVSDKIASAKRNPVQTGNPPPTTNTTIRLLLLLLIIIIMIMGDARVRVKEKLEINWALF